MLKRFVINAHETRIQNELRQKFAKKGLLIKILTSNKKKTDSLLDILKESDDLNTLRTRSGKLTEEEYLSKFRNSRYGGPKHSIAVGRAHHLSNFLSEYIINAFQTGHFDSPKISNKINSDFNSNDSNNEKFSFEISNVELMSDLSALKIYWFRGENEQLNKKIEDYLEKNLKSKIRATLASERIINYVPTIMFIRDESKFLMNQLDNYLLKLKLETKGESTGMENNLNDIKNDKVNNLYGLNVDDVVESLATNTARQVVEVCKFETERNILCSINETSSFESSLKAFEINKRLKQKRMSKSTLLKLAQIEFEDFKNNN